MQIDKRMITNIIYKQKQFSYVEGSCPLMPLIAQFKDDCCIVLSGKAGSGKSIQIQLFRFMMIKNKRPFFYINLNREQTSKNEFEAKIKQIKEFSDANTQTELWVIFDSHDEMSLSVESKFYDAIQYILKCQKVRILIGTRLSADDLQRRMEGRFSFTYAELQEIDENKLGQIINLRKIEDNPKLIELLRTPLFLFLYKQNMEEALLTAGEMDEVAFFERFIDTSIKGEDSDRESELRLFLSGIGEYLYNNITGKRNISRVGEEGAGLYIPANFNTLFYVDKKNDAEIPQYRCKHALFEQYTIAVFLANELLKSNFNSFDFSLFEKEGSNISVRGLLRDSLIFAGRLLAIRNRKDEAEEYIRENIVKATDEIKNNLAYFLCGCNEFVMNIKEMGDSIFENVSTNKLLQTLGGCSYCKKLWVYEDVKLPNRVILSRLKIKFLGIGSEVHQIKGLAYLLAQTLDMVEVDASNETFYSENNCVIAKREKRLELGCKTSTIPTEVMSIMMEAFDNCQGLTDEEVKFKIPKNTKLLYPQISAKCAGYEDFNYEIDCSNGEITLIIRKNQSEGWKVFYATHSAHEINKCRKERAKEYWAKVGKIAKDKEMRERAERFQKDHKIMASVLFFGSPRSFPLWSRPFITALYCVLWGIGCYLITKFVLTSGFWHVFFIVYAIGEWGLGSILASIAISILFFGSFYQVGCVQRCRLNQELNKRIKLLQGYYVVDIVKRYL